MRRNDIRGQSDQNVVVDFILHIQPCLLVNDSSRLSACPVANKNASFALSEIFEQRPTCVEQSPSTPLRAAKKVLFTTCATRCFLLEGAPRVIVLRSSERN